MNEYVNDNEDTVRERRMQRMREMQRNKRKQMMIRRYIRVFTPLVAGLVLVVVLLVNGGRMLYQSVAKEDVGEITEQVTENTESAGNKVLAIQPEIEVYMASAQPVEEAEKQEQESAVPYSAHETAKTKSMSNQIGSSYGIFLDPVNDEIIAQRNAMTRMNPASMTKVLTVLVAAEHIEQEKLDDKFTITLEITDYGYANDCSSAGFEKDEIVTIKDLFYGTILPSGADAAMGLAVYVAGDHETFVEMMNQKLEELGLSQTAHVTNCVGVYDDNHYCTAYDMAMIMEAALDNELCREVMTAHTYTTSITEQHPEGMILSNWFLRRIEDRDTGGEVICAKTGYVNEAGSCAVSYGMDKAGNEYICVTAGAENQWRCIDDHEHLYKGYAQGDE